MHRINDWIRSQVEAEPPIAFVDTRAAVAKRRAIPTSSRNRLTGSIRRRPATAGWPKRSCLVLDGALRGIL